MDWARILAYVTGTVDQEILSKLEQIPVMFEHSRHDERSSCILAG
jgi:hypothetical protein